MEQEIVDGWEKKRLGYLLPRYLVRVCLSQNKYLQKKKKIRSNLSEYLEKRGCGKVNFDINWHFDV